jgi:hypothetical protein
VEFNQEAFLKPYKDKFNTFINVLYVKYLYNGEYPKKRLGKNLAAGLRKLKSRLTL